MPKDPLLRARQARLAREAEERAKAEEAAEHLRRAALPPEYRAYDLNNDGIVSQNEFRGSDRLTFRRADTDGDGLLDKDELRRSRARLDMLAREAERRKRNDPTLNERNKDVQSGRYHAIIYNRRRN